MNNIEAYIEESAKLLSTDISEFQAEDQILLLTYYMEFISKVKPIYLRNLDKDPKATNFLFKLYEDIFYEMSYMLWYYISC